MGEWIAEAYFWRVNAVAVGGRPWRVAIQVHTAAAGPGVMLASEIPDQAPWAQQLASRYLQAVHARLARHAVPAGAPPGRALAAGTPPPQTVAIEADPAHETPLRIAIDATHTGVVRYRPAGLTPAVGELEGTAVSAYYSLEGRGQVEERRGDIAVAGGEAVVVPLWGELPTDED